MPSVNSGNRKIKTIKVFKDHVTLSFFKGEQLKISKEAYLSSYIYEGKSLSKKEIAKLEEITAMSALLNYALTIINKKRLSEKEMLNKLMAKENNFSAAKNIIKKLKENGLIDDKALMEDLIAWDNERNFGVNKIIKHLKDKGIPESLLDKASFPSSIEKKKAKALLPKLEKKYERYSFANKKRHVYQALISHGFNNDVAKETADLMKNNDEKTERKLLLKEYDKVRSRYEKKCHGYQLKQKIYNYLLNKGYKYQDIAKVLELEDFNNEDDSGF